MTSPSLQHTQAAVVALRNKNTFAHLLANVPKSIEQALERPTVSAMVNAGAKKESIEACLAIEIARTANMLTVGGNLREGQALEIAIQLISDYPNESLDDFCLCLRRGIKHYYGDIYRFDVMVINEWFREYLDEKYQVIEDKLMREKDDHYSVIMVPDPSLPEAEVQTLTEEAKNQKVKDRLKEWRNTIEAVNVRPVLPLTDEEIKQEGQQNPPKPVPYKDRHTPEWYALRDKIRRTASEFYKDKYSLTGMKIFPISDQEIFAESESDAIKIYEEAKNQNRT